MAIGLPDNSNSQFNPTDGAPVTTLPYRPTDGGGATPGDPTGSANGGGGLNLSNLSNWFDNIGNGTSPLSRSAMLLPALATAYNSYRNSQRIQDTAERAATVANPFGQYRQFYGDRLKALYDDPSQIENTPGYKFALSQGLGSVERSNAAQGYLGSGKMNTDLMEYGSGLAAQTFDKERNALMQMSGAQFNPANAADMLMRGEEGGIRERGNALAAIGQLLKPGNSTNITNGGGGGGPANGGDGNIKLPNGGSIPAARILQQLQSSGMNPATAAQLFQRIISSPIGLDQSTVQLLERLGVDTNVDLGGEDHAGFGQGGFGGDNPIDPSTQPIVDDLYGTPDGGSIFGPDSNVVGGGSFGPTDIWANGGSDSINLNDIDFDLGGFFDP